MAAAKKAANKNRAVQRRKNRASKEAKLESNLVTVRRVVEQSSPAAVPVVVVAPAAKKEKTVVVMEEFDLCVSVAPTLPSSTPIPINKNMFAALCEVEACNEVLCKEEIICEPRKGLLARAGNVVKGLVAKAAKFLKKAMKAVQNLIC